MGKNEMKRGISQRSSDAGDNQSYRFIAGMVRQNTSKIYNLWLLSCIVMLRVPITASSTNCLRCFAAVDSIDINSHYYELQINMFSHVEGNRRNDTTEDIFKISYFDETRKQACEWGLDIVDSSFTSYFNRSSNITNIVNHISNAMGNYLRIHCLMHDDSQPRTDTIKFRCFDTLTFYRLCEIQKDLESSYLRNVMNLREKREFRPKRCSLNNLLSTNRKIYEFGMENEDLTSHSQTILSTIYLVTDVITEFFNRKLAHSRKSFYRSDLRRDADDTVVQKISSSIEIVLLQTIKYHILHKLGLRERPNVTRIAKNEYVFEAIDRVYGNKINIGNTYAGKHYYSKYLQANLSKDFSNSFVDTFFEATDIGTSSGSVEKQYNLFPKKMKYKQPTQSDSEKQSLFGGTKILSFAEKGLVIILTSM